MYIYMPVYKYICGCYSHNNWLGRVNGGSMNQLAELRSKQGITTFVGYDFSSSLEELVQQGNLGEIRP